VDDGAVTLSTSEEESGDRADVVVTLSYEDAAALSRGELDPTEALGTGRVHVRGDLSVLVAGQGILAAAAGRMADLQANTSY
jgi:putative sterol carrier protein